MLVAPVAMATLRRFSAPQRATEGGPVRLDYYNPTQDQRRIEEYYGDLPTTLKPERLFDRLNKLVTRTHDHVAAYHPAKHVYPRVDRRPDGELRCIYSLDALQIGLDMATCEHAVARVWFRDKQPMRGDMHILFACEKEVNEERGHARLGEVGANGIAGKGGRFSPDMSVFEPDHGKGAVARATLYFLVRYPGEIHQYDLGTLLKWHREDPVSDHERHRNSEIQARQGNRNPFIDFPEWAELVRFR